MRRRWYEEELTRDFDCFPRLKEANYGKRVSRMKVEAEETKKSIVPKDMKGLLKKYREWSVWHKQTAYLTIEKEKS